MYLLIIDLVKYLPYFLRLGKHASIDSVEDVGGQKASSGFHLNPVGPEGKIGVGLGLPVGERNIHLHSWFLSSICS